MITTARFRQLALAFDDATEVPHMERQAFRTPRRTYVTLAADGRSANLGFNPELQDMFTRSRPHAFTAIPNGWGRMGWTTVDLDAVDEPSLKDALAAAHALAQPVPKPAKKPTATKKAVTKKATAPKTNATQTKAKTTTKTMKKTPAKPAGSARA